MRYAFVAAHRREFRPATMCRVLRMHRSGFYAWTRSPQGSQYGSDDVVRFCKDHGLIPSMRRRGNCFENAVAESFFSSLKKERIRRRIYRSREESRADVFDYIEVFYNRIRRHSHLGHMSPHDYEQAALTTA